MNDKTCYRCKESKPITEFGIRRSSKDGLRGCCKTCHRKTANAKRDRNRLLSKKVREKAKKSLKKCSLSENIILFKKCYSCKRSRPQDCFTKKSRSKDLLNDICRDCDRERSRKYIFKRRNSDKLFKVKDSVSNLIRCAIRRNGYSKNKPSKSILGCDYEFFIEWMGNNIFNKNYEIDHVIPMSMAKSENEVYLLNHYSNLQSLHRDKNRLKLNKYIKKPNLKRVFLNSPNPELIYKIVKRSGIKIIE